MERISSVDAEVSSRAAACREAPSARLWLVVDTWAAADETFSALSERRAVSRLSASLALCTMRKMPAPTASAMSAKNNSDVVRVSGLVHGCRGRSGEVAILAVD